MKILALETATITGSIAILDTYDGLIGESRVNIQIAHAERLMSSVDWLLRASQLSIHDMDAFAVSIGPGSFTGLRIGLSTVKGFCFATNKPIVPVPTLDALAQTLPFCSHLICPMLDARKNEVYTGLYRWGKGILEKVIPETAASPEDFTKNIQEMTVFLGEGAQRYETVIQDALHSRAVFAPDSRMSPSASTVAEIALEKLNRGIHTDPVNLTPFYIRKSEAEIRWKGP
jgi:tRNA threonylcarbamoyladenosine biosynthesis protein TsaB